MLFTRYLMHPPVTHRSPWKARLILKNPRCYSLLSRLHRTLNCANRYDKSTSCWPNAWEFWSFSKTHNYLYLRYPCRQLAIRTKTGKNTHFQNYRPALDHCCPINLDQEKFIACKDYGTLLLFFPSIIRILQNLRATSFLLILSKCLYPLDIQKSILFGTECCTFLRWVSYFYLC